jgi:hypothetical protein
MMHLPKIILIALTLLLLIVGFFFLKKAFNNSKTLEAYRQKETVYKQQVKFWKDEEAKSRASARVFEAEGKVAKEVMENKWNEIKKDIKGLKNINNLRSRTEIRTVYKDTLYIPLKDTLYLKGDSLIKYQTFNYSDSTGFNHYKGTIRNGRLSIDAEIEVPLTATIYRKRKPKKHFFDFFPGRETLVESKSLNPKVTITDLEAIQIKPKKKFLGLF